MPSVSSTPALSPRFALALQFANELHGRQVRKGRGAPYISHLMAVSALVLEFGGTEDQAIAALLHDAVEDCGGAPMLASIRQIFGEEVARIVDACTDTMGTPKPAWLPRKSTYIARLAQEPAACKFVACADKISNLGNTLRDITTEGVESWIARMEQTPNGGASKQLWYYRACRDAFSQGWADPILGEFQHLVAEFDALMEGRAQALSV